MKKKFNVLSRLMAVFLALLLCVPGSFSALAAQESAIIYVKTAEDLRKVCAKCALDAWSVGKTVVLTADISLTGTDFDPIPIFGGTFDGAGFSITGLTVSGKFSSAGLFETLATTGVVRNLTVNGTVAPAGTNDRVGGIVGENNGRIVDCSFRGAVTGSARVGGIAGLNGPEGRIEGCSASGSVTGKSMTGGIAGKSLGTISACENRAFVNLSEVDPKLEWSDLSLPQSQSWLTLQTLDTVNIATDTGGIAGYSSGLVLSCKNLVTVGYPHIGYNVGGIVGRSSGHLYNCVNRGAVLGRKDVGGIVGQAEPYIVLNLSSDLLEDLRGQLNQLHTLVNSTGDTAQNSTDALSDRFTAINSSLSLAMEQAETLTDLLDDYGNETITELNRGSDLVKDTVDALAGLSDEGDLLTAHLSDSFAALDDAMKELENAADSGADAADQLRSAVSKLQKGGKKLQSGLQEIEDGLLALSNALRVEDAEAASAALAAIQTGVQDSLAAAAEVSGALELLADALKEHGFQSEEAAAAAQALTEAQRKLTSALGTISQGLDALQKNVTFDFQQIKTGVVNIIDGLELLDSALSQFNSAATPLQTALKHASTSSQHLSAAFQHLSTAMERFQDATTDLEAMGDEIESLLTHLSSADPLQLAHPDEALSDSADGLFRALEQLNGQLDALNATSTSSADQLLANLRAVSNQFQRTTNTLLDAVEQAESASDDLLSDLSDENVDAVTSGKLLACTNEGDITGDINVGGIAGAMSVELELDPEDDRFSSDASLYRKEYEMKAILQSCVNTGTVTSRRNYAGAICGRMDLGLILDCEGYGSATSEQTDYVGGVAGYAAGTLRRSFAKCRLSGRNYVGGIVGMADSSAKILRCCSWVQITACQQFSGAISGSREGIFQENYFISDSLAGLDRVSLAGEAEPIPYAELLETDPPPTPSAA